MRKRGVLIIGAVALVAAAGGWIFRGRIREALADSGISSRRTAEDVVAQHGDRTRESLESLCRAHGVAWPPARLRLLAFKEERRVEVWVANADGPYARVRTYAILAASGGPGPKRREGDLQVPEGIYRLTDLNPNSRFHLSVRVDYPNEEDVRRSHVKRREMGGDIFIHGGAASIGCIALGDAVIEELFSLVALVPRDGRSVLIAPVDLRTRADFTVAGEEAWVANLYGRLAQELRAFPVGP